MTFNTNYEVWHTAANYSNNSRANRRGTLSPPALYGEEQGPDQYWATAATTLGNDAAGMSPDTLTRTFADRSERNAC